MMRGGGLSFQAYKETNREYLATSQEEGSRSNLEHLGSVWIFTSQREVRV